LRRMQSFDDLEYGFEIQAVEDARGNPLPYTISDTHMRVDLPRPLEPGRSTVVSIDWEHQIINEEAIGGRGGYEHFPKTDTYQYFLAQWYPRATAYSDYDGWHNKAFLGRGEFTLEFGDYEVRLTVPADHVVAATGELQNAGAVLSGAQRARLAEARDADAPVFVVTPEEALANEAEKADGEKTWVFRARNVRDFAWASSRKYIWDAMGYRQDDDETPFVMAMSFYPNEGEPIWSRYSTHAVVHTMEVYSDFSFPYPYPTAQSVNSWESGGMEYPMITFNGYRPTPGRDGSDPTYSRRVKAGLIGVIIHEIGHIYFPMTVNSDERQWTWMDEGINTFLEYMAELQWEEAYPAFREHTNVLDYITDYMTSENQVPIMTQSDSVLQFGPNAYSKPAAALTVLRETVMGRELFDFAFKEYSNRWRFKRPTPADFFRTMEDASGVDLDWFWRGWFYSTDHVDVAVADVREVKISSQNPDVEFLRDREEFRAETPPPLTVLRNRGDELATRIDRYPELRDFYNDNDRFTVSNKDRNDFTEFRSGLEAWQAAALDRALEEDQFFYFIDFANLGGLVTPLPLTLAFEDGTSEEMTLPAEIWRRSPKRVTKMIASPKKLVSVELDAAHEIADADHSNNHFPPRIAPSRIDAYKRDRNQRDLMADMLVELGAQNDKAESADAGAVP
ncbi:MAG: M1 family metallopeptidase, partial [Caulobacterales bacterium]|nr:M1 family metallopeptidase [Caulobacterales bacterium]